MQTNQIQTVSRSAYENTYKNEREVERGKKNFCKTLKKNRESRCSHEGRTYAQHIVVLCEFKRLAQKYSV